MRLISYDRDDILVLEPEGKIMPGPDEDELKERLNTALGQGKRNVTIDFGKAPWICSSPLSLLLYYNRKYKQIGGKLKFANLTGKFQQIIAITKVASEFDVYQNLDTALASFKN